VGRLSGYARSKQANDRVTGGNRFIVCTAYNVLTIYYV
jgi:hypothetical protein